MTASGTSTRAELCTSEPPMLARKPLERPEQTVSTPTKSATDLALRVTRKSS